MWDGFDQRKFPRIHLNCELTINPTKEGDPVVRAVTENVGAGGVSVIQEFQFERFSKCQVKLELAKGEEPIACEGKVAWIIPRSDPKAKKTMYDTGIEFVDLDPNEKARLAKYVEEKIDRGFKELP